MEETTENAVGAVRRRHEGTLSADALRSSLSPAHSAEARSGRLDASAAVDHA
jgi:hypothetical protein